MLSLDPEAASRPLSIEPSHYNSDIDGCLPLHLILQSCIWDLDIVKRLFDAYPQAILIEDSFGRIPLVMAMTSYVPTKPEAIRMREDVISFLKNRDSLATVTANIGLEKCEVCGMDDNDQGQLKTCDGCHLAIYCSRRCQRKGWSSHKTICKMLSANDLPLPDSSSLNLLSDTITDFRSGLQYALYMADLKHLKMAIQKEHCKHLLLAANDLWSFFVSKKWKFQSFSWIIDDDCEDYARKVTGQGKVWEQLRGIKVLRMVNPVFRTAYGFASLLRGQYDALLVLSVHGMKLISASKGLPWSRNEKKDYSPYAMDDCSVIVGAIRSCKKLVKLELADHHLHDNQIDQILPCLPYLKVLRLSCQGVEGALTDKTCMAVSKLRRLQSLDLSGHNVTVSGVKRVLTCCFNLRDLTCSGDVSLGELKGLLKIAPRLLHFGFGTQLKQNELTEVVEEIGGRTIIHFFSDPPGMLPGLSQTAKFQYELNLKLFQETLSKAEDPDVFNEWKELS